MAVITIGIDPEIHLGPVTLSWHGLTIVIGVLVGGLAAGRVPDLKLALAGRWRSTIRKAGRSTGRSSPRQRLIR